MRIQAKQVVIGMFMSLLMLASAGDLVAIGGALEPDNEAIYQAVIARASSDDPLICILGTASSDPVSSAESYVSDFTSYGADSTIIDITVDNAAEASYSDEVVSEVAGCHGFFFTGGDQRRITEALLIEDGMDTPVMAAIREQFEAGAVIAGTSAGAAMMSTVMISGGSSVDTLLGSEGTVTTEAGLGFVDSMILDQHFVERGRFGRLIGALAEAGLGMGAGIGENTALAIGDDGTLEVIGEGHVALITLIEEAEVDSLEVVSGVRISLLSHGDVVDETGTVTILTDRENTAEVGFYYDEGTIFAVDIFGPSVLADVLTQLVDSPEAEASGLAFAGAADASFESDGVRVVFSKDETTQGYWGRVDGENYSVVNVLMVVEPITVSVVPRE
ncbi:MAG: cyanophycinase [Deinococcota bacterium]